MGSIPLPIRITFKGSLKNLESPGVETRYIMQHFNDLTSEWNDVYGAMTSNGGTFSFTYSINSSNIDSLKSETTGEQPSNNGGPPKMERPFNSPTKHWWMRAPFS